jgi:ANTAR domain-containing protein
MMETRGDQTEDPGDSRRRSREQYGYTGRATWPAHEHAGPDRERDEAQELLDGGRGGQGRTGPYRGRHSQTAGSDHGHRTAGAPGPHGGPARGHDTRGEDPGGGHAQDHGVRRTATGWRVGDEEVSDLTSAMVLADLLAAELPAEGPPTPGSPAAPADSSEPAEAEPADNQQLQETVAQLEHALTVRVRVEQAIGVLAERHRLRPRQAFELLRSAARARGRRVLEVAGEVVDSASNPLLRIPEELAKPPVIRRGRMSRRSRPGEPGPTGSPTPDVP